MTLTLERVKPTEDAILEMVRNHYSHKQNTDDRPRTAKTSKTWWSNARLVVFSDPERTLVFAWQWPRDGYRKDGQNGFNNILFHRSKRCPYKASEIILAAVSAAFEHWGENRCYTYVDADKIASSNPGYCYKMAGWKFLRNSANGKPLLTLEVSP